MKDQKIIIGAFSVIACFFVVYFLASGFSGGGVFSKIDVGQPSFSKNEGKNEVSSDNTEGAFDSSIKWIENLASGSSLGENITNQASEDLSSKFISNINFDKASSAKELLDSIDFNNLNSGSLEKIVGENALAFISEIKDSEIKISQDNSSQSLSKYKKDYDSAMEGIFSFLEKSKNIESSLSEVVEKDKTSKIDSALDIMKKGEKDLKNILVPSSLSDFHKKTLIFVGNFEIIFQSFRSYKEDPLKAFLALDYFSNVADQWDGITSDAKNIFKL